MADLNVDIQKEATTYYFLRNSNMKLYWASLDFTISDYEGEPA